MVESLIDKLDRIRENLFERMNTFSLSKEDYYGIVLLALFDTSLSLLKSKGLYEQFFDGIPASLVEDYEVIVNELDKNR
jgi:hypothetical protein